MKTYPLLGATLIGFLTVSQFVFAKPDLSSWKASYQYEANGEYEAAAAVLTDQLALPSAKELTLLRTGWLHYQQGNYNDAIAAYQQALKLNADSIDTLLGLTLPLMAQLRYKDVAYYSEQVLVKDPWNFIAHSRLLWCRLQLKQWPEMQQQAYALAKHYPSQIEGWLYLARAEAWLGDSKAAYVHYQHVLRLSPDNVEALHYLNQAH